MSTQKLYFLKINLNSEIYDLYNGRINKEDVCNDILRRFSEKNEFIKEEISPEGKRRETKFEFINTIKDEKEKIIYGEVLKQAKIKTKRYDKKTRKFICKRIDTNEVVKFYYDIRKETVVYNIANRFGYTEFCAAFEGLINKSFHCDGKFKVAVYREGVNIDEIKNKLLSLGCIRLLKINFIPPNPRDELLEAIEKNGEKRLNELKEANVTERSVIFKSINSKGLNINSSMLNKELTNAVDIHSDMLSGEAVKKGYVTVQAEEGSGRTYTTEDNRPLTVDINKKSVEDINLFIIECRKSLIMFLEKHK